MNAQSMCKLCIITPLLPGWFTGVYLQCNSTAGMKGALCMHSAEHTAFVYHVGHAMLQLELAKAGVHLFVEKPLSVRPAAEVAELAHQLKQIQDKNK